MRFLEQFLAVVGTAACLALSAWIGQFVSRTQPIWPLPGLYLAEMVLVSILGMFGVAGNRSGRSSLRIGMTWAAAGILLAFVIMGAWSIGLFFSPVVLIFAATAILATRRHGQAMFFHVGISILSAIAQAALMLAVIRLMYP